MGGLWTTQRLAREREPRLRGRVERERGRIGLFWASSADFRELAKELESFRASLRGLAAAPAEMDDRHL